MKIAILGFGVVGSGVYEILKTNEKICVKTILEQKVQGKNHQVKFTNNFDDILFDDEIELVVETLGGYEFARDCIKKLLCAKKHVVTANKEVIAKDMDVLLNLAYKNQVHLLFEASVGGGIPLIKGLRKIKEVSKITKIEGILNGSTNYIMTKLQKGKTLSDALDEARKNGFLEKDPTDDLEGFDMMRKIAILANLAFDTFVPLDKIKVSPFTKITKELLDEAALKGEVVKYVCMAEVIDDTLKIEVSLKNFPKTHLFASVNDELNVAIFDTFPNGPLAYFGKGAGGAPTAAAIVSDIYDVINNTKYLKYENKNKYEII